MSALRARVGVATMWPHRLAIGGDVGSFTDPDGFE